MKNIVVLASGSGSNFQSIIDSVEAGKINARIAGLISNKPGIKALDRATKHNIPCSIISEKEYSTHLEFSKTLLRQLDNWDTDLIILAGYLRKIPTLVIQNYKNRILNIHPSLLPKYGGKGFYGMNVHNAVLESGDTESGCSVHIVSEEYDKGPILDQIKVPVYKNDAPEKLAKRVLEQEHILYPRVISKYLTTFSK
ncbi:MAG: phosphoribosylglycinamide formyltransferase [Balneolaceae bacterium]